MKLSQLVRLEELLEKGGIEPEVSQMAKDMKAASKGHTGEPLHRS